MTSYSVIWADGGPVEAGRLELQPEGIAFHGAMRELAVPFGEIESVHVGRAPEERLGGKPALVVALCGGLLLRIGSLDGLGSVNELASVLAGHAA